MDASNKQPTVAEKFAAVWEKKNAKAARAGGVSLMALSLAACGSSSTTTTSTDTSTSTDTTTTPVASGNTVTLTKEVDTVSTSATTTGMATSTAGDTIVAVLSDTAADNTFNIADSINGGAGTDVLDLRMVNDGTSGITSSGLQTVAVETIKIDVIDSSTSGTTATLDAAGFDGATGITIDGATVLGTTDDTLALTNVATDVSITIGSNDADLDISVTTAGTATSADTITLNLTGGANGDITVDDAADGYATVAIATSGSAATVDSVADGGTAGTELTKMTVTGDQALTIKNAIDTDITSFDASGNSGAVTMTAAVDADLTLKGGSGASDKANLTVGETVASGMSVSGFETLAFTTSGAYSFDMDVTSGASSVAISGSTSNGSSNTLTLADISLTSVNLTGTGKDEAQYFNAVTYDLKDASGSADTVTFAIANGGVATATTNTATAGLITADKIENVNISVADFTKVDASVTADDAEKFTFTGAAELDLATFTAGSSTEAIDAAGYSGKLTLGLLTGVTGDFTYTGSTGVDVVTLEDVAAGKEQTFNLGTGADEFTFDATINATGKAVVNGDAGNDVFTISSAADSTGTLEVDGGAGTNKIVVNGEADNKTVTFNSLANIDEIEQGATDSAGATDTFQLSATVATGWDDALKVTDVSAATTIIDITTSAGGTVDFSNITLIGWTSGTDLLQFNTNTGSETITLGATKNGADVSERVVFDTGSGTDTIVGFTVGSGGDIIVIDLDAAASAPIDGAGTAVSAGDTPNIEDVTGDESLAATENIAYIAGDYTSTAALKTALESGSRELSLTGHTATVDEDIIVVYDDGTHSYVAIANIDAVTTTAIDTVTIDVIAKLSGIADADTLTADNFAFI